MSVEPAGEQAATARNKLLDRATALHNRAREALWAYEFDHGRVLLHEALHLLAAVSEPTSPDVVEVLVRVVVSLSYAESEAGSLDVGLAHLDDAQRKLSAIGAGSKHDELAGLVLSHRGFMLIRAGRTDEGLALLDESAELLERGIDGGAGDPNVLAGVYINRSLAFIDRAQTREAMDALNQCIQFADQHHLPEVGLKARHNLGYVAFMTGDVLTALRYYEEAERGYLVHAPGALPVVRHDLARALLAAGLSEEAARHLDEALPQLRRQRVGQDAAEAELTRAAAGLLDGDLAQARTLALAAGRAFTKRGNARWAAIAELTALRAETVSALARGRVPNTLPVKAVKLADRLRTLMLEDETSVALLLAVRMELRRDDRDAASVLLDQVPKPRATTPIDHVMLARLCRAELAVAEGNRGRALRESRAGLTELGRVRDRMGGLDLVCGTAIHGRELGRLAVGLVLGSARSRPRQVFGWLERTRAQVYRYEPMPAIDDPVIADKVTELRHLTRTVQQERLAGRSVDTKIRHATELENEVLRTGWYTTPWGSPRPVATLDAVQSALGDRVLVTLAVSGGELIAVAVTSERARLLRLGSARQAAEHTQRLNADLNALAPDHLPPPLVAVVGDSARRSADALDAQLRALWTAVGSRELVVVPTGALYAAPWGSLPALRGRPVVVAPSATAWLTASNAAHRDGPAVLATGPMLTAGVGENDRLRAIYPGATNLRGTTATANAVLAALDGAGLAHLAAHGEHQPTNALFSRLEMSDGPLFAHEVAQLRRPPQQVVLAACELALNHIRPGDEALGFAGALLASGVRTVVAAVCKVGDQPAAESMVNYHARVASGVRPAVALAESVAADPFRRPFVCLGAG